MPRKSKVELEMAEAGLLAEKKIKKIVFPESLVSSEEKDIYERIIKDFPNPEVLNGGSEALLVQLVRHIVRANQLSEMLATNSDPDTFLKLLKAEKDCSMVISSTCVKLKLTPSALAGFKAKPTEEDIANRPWNA